MAATHSDQQDQADRLFLNLPSNNPFRNRAASPSVQSPTASPFDDPPPRPLSRNPFLDPTLTSRASNPNIRSVSDNMSSLDKRPSLTAEEIFGSLTLVDSKPAPPRSDAAKPAPPPPPAGRRGPPPPGRETMQNRPGPGPNHRPTRSQEEAMRAGRKQSNAELLIPIDPPRSPQRPRQERRPRRNSDSSIVGADKIMTEEERKARDQRRRERERRHREGKDKKPASRKLDIIDQLDATSIYGTGIFHHDGPFDALNPHRNRTGSRRAPMQAFPEGSLNNTLGGSGPLNARPDHSTFLGAHDDEAFREWSKGAKDRNGTPPTNSKGETPMFDPLSRGAILHGDESLGLGTSTFLEGTPAARAAIQKREEEKAQEAVTEGLQRKKSLAHRIRNINRAPRDFQSSGRMTNPEAPYGSRRSPSESTPTSAGISGERNPFFNEYGRGGGGGGGGSEEGFSVRKDSSAGPKSPGSPKSGGGYGLERRSTTDGTGGGDENPQPKSGGILGRMKSLKGGRRQRPGQGSSDMGAAAPGTAV